MREGAYQRGLISRLEALFPGCVIIKNNPQRHQGLPDILILFRDRWAALEVKISSTADEQPNQRYYVDKFDDMSYASFVCPQNEEEVLDALQSTFGALR